MAYACSARPPILLSTKAPISTVPPSGPPVRRQHGFSPCTCTGEMVYRLRLGNLPVEWETLIVSVKSL